MGTGPIAKAKLFLVASAMARSRWPADRRVKVSVRALGKRARFVVSTLSDLLVLRDTFLFEDYAEDLGDPQTIVDLGSNIGASVVYFRLRYPEARIIGVEPDPDAFAKLKCNTACFDGIELRNVAVAERSGETVLHRHDQSWGSSLVEWWEDTTAVRVRAQRLDDLINELGFESIDLLKIDIEGAEWEVLPSFEQLQKVRAIVGEIHAYLSDTPARELLSCLDEFRVRTDPELTRHVPFVATRP